MKKRYLILGIACAVIIIAIGVIIAIKVANSDDDAEQFRRISQDNLRKIEDLKIRWKDLDPNESLIESKIPYRIYYINMDRSRDRNELMRSQSQLTGKHLHRVEAIDGSALKNPFKGDISDGEYGRLMSHLKAITTAFEDDVDVCVIMEDDESILLALYWDKSLADLVREAPKDWTVINLQPFRTGVDVSSKFIKRSDMHELLGTGVYIINRKGIELVQSLDISKLDHKEAELVIYHIPGSYEYRGKGMFFTQDSQTDSTIHKGRRRRENLEITKTTLRDLW